MLAETIHDLVVVGGGPSGATAAHDAARAGLDVVLLDQPGAPGLGAGECAAGPVAAAIANAVQHAIGVRVRDLPMTPERIARLIEAAD